MTFSREMQARYNIAPVGTVTVHEDARTGKSLVTYRAGPRTYEVSDLKMDYGIPTLQKWFEAYRDGEDPGNLADCVPDKINASVNKGTFVKSLSFVNYFENWLFSRLPSVTLVDPSSGSLWRCWEKNCPVRVYMTASDNEWWEQIDRQFSPIYRDRKLLLERVYELEGYVYHGTNGFKTTLLTAKDLCLEPNPFSSDLRKEEGVAIRREANGFRVHYYRKSKLREHVFVDLPSYYRIDPISLELFSQAYGDSFFFSSTFDPSIIGLRSLKRRYTSLATCYHYDEYPSRRTITLGGYEVNMLDGVLYDVKCHSTVLSRRHLLHKLAREYGYKVAPLKEGYGKWIAHPYAYDFACTSYARVGEVHVHEDYTMYNRPMPQGESVKGKNAVIFKPGDFTGRQLTPLESLGTIFDIPTLCVSGDPRRYPVIGDHTNGYVYGSIQSLLQNMLYIFFCEKKDVVPMIDFETEKLERKADPVTDVVDFTDDAPKQSFKDRVLDLVSQTPMTLDELQRVFPDLTEQRIWQTMWYCSEITAKKVSDQVHYGVFDTEYEDVDMYSGGLAGVMCQAEVKARIIQGNLEFEDPEEFDVLNRIHDLALWGYVICRVQTDDGMIKREFSKT